MKNSGRGRAGRISGLIGLVANLILGLVKILIGALTSSIAVAADGLNNLGDAGSSGAVVAGFSLIDKKPTEKYPLGYGKVEYLLSVIISVILFAAGFSYFYMSLERIVYFHVPIYFLWRYFIILAATVPVKFALFLIFRRYQKSSLSPVLKAFSLDSFADMFITLSVLASYLLTRVTSFPADGIAGILISAYIIFTAVKIFLSSFRSLAGASDEEIKIKRK